MASSSWIRDLLQFVHDDPEGDDFTIREPSGGDVGRLYGGLIAAQALGAAGATVGDGKLPQSLHAYFVRGGRYEADVHFHVDRIRDGRAFATRRVTASQDGVVILEMLTSFHEPEPGLDWYPSKAGTLAYDDAVRKHSKLSFSDLFELRTRPDDDSQFAVPPFWIRTHQEIEPDPLIRACALTFMSDMGPVPSALPPTVKPKWGDCFAASLDHSVWFHRPFDPHRWHRYELAPVNHNDSRGLTTGAFYTDGDIPIATVTQEALWRM